MGEGRSLREVSQKIEGKRDGVSLKSKEYAEKIGNIDLTKVGDGSLKNEPLKDNDPRKLYQNVGDGSLKNEPLKDNDPRKLYQNVGDGSLKNEPLKPGDKRIFYRDLGR